MTDDDGGHGTAIAWGYYEFGERKGWVNEGGPLPIRKKIHPSKMKID